MADLKRTLFPLQLNLLTAGCNLFPYKYRWMNFCLSAHKIVLIVITFYAVIGSREGTGTSLISRLYRIYHNFTDLCSIIAILAITYSSRKIRTTLVEVASYLTPRDHVILFRCSCLLLLYKIIHLIPRIWNMTNYVSFMTRSGLRIPLVRQIDTYRYVDSWLATTFSLFVCVLWTVHAGEKNCLENLMKTIRPETGVSPMVIHLEVSKFIRVKREVMKQLSVVIAMRFLYVFIGCIVGILRIQFNRKNDTQDEIFAPEVYFVYLIMLICETALIAFMTGNLNERTELILEELETKIVMIAALSQQVHHCNFVIECIHKSQQFEYDASGFFVLNKKILLSFVASLISFTVIFGQLLVAVVDGSQNQGNLTKFFQSQDT